VKDDDGAAHLGDVARAQDLAHRYGCNYVDLHKFRVPPGIVKIVPAGLMFRYNFVPLEETADGCIAAAFADPSQLMLIDEVSLLLGKRIIPRVATLRQISAALGSLGEAQETDENITQILPPEEPLGQDDTDAPVLAPLKPRPHPRSGAAQAIPEPEQ
jgi:hypothetical protein